MATMEAVYYHGVRNFEIANVPIPEIADDEILLKVACCGICGTDSHISEGEFISKFPLIPGHEYVGTIAKLGSKVKGFEIGDRCVADPASTCGECFYCRRGNDLLCEHFASTGVTMEGGFAEYVKIKSRNAFKIYNLSDEEATLVEPASCAVHGADKLALPVGSEVLIIGAGPTGLILSQLLKLTGAYKVVLAANKGIKTKLAEELDAADVYIELDRQNPEEQWAQLKKDHPYGFDAVVEATGSEKIANSAIDYVCRGGTLMLYGVYDNSARVHYAPSKIFGDEIRIIGSFAERYCFPRAVAYLDSGKIKVKGMVTNTYRIQDYQQALDKLKTREAVKIVVKP